MFLSLKSATTSPNNAASSLLAGGVLSSIRRVAIGFMRRAPLSVPCLAGTAGGNGDREALARCSVAWFIS